MRRTTNDSNGDQTIDFGLIPNHSIGSTVFFDMDDDGLQDANPQETGISGVTVQLLYDANNDNVIDNAELIPVLTTTTDANGDYFFGSLPAGNYQVVIPTVPASAPLSSSVTDTNDNSQDGDDNGSQPGGPGTAVISPIVNLSNGAEALNAAETFQGGTQDGTLSNPDNQGDMTVDFGFKPALSIGSTVFYDADNSGTQEDTNPLENGIAGITVQLWQDTDNNGIGDYLVGTDVTDSNGDYFFGMLSPGNYVVAIRPARRTHRPVRPVKTATATLTATTTGRGTIGRTIYDHRVDPQRGDGQRAGPGRHTG